MHHGDLVITINFPSTCFISSSKPFSSGTWGWSTLANCRTVSWCLFMSSLVIFKSGECITLFRTDITLIVKRKWCKDKMCHPLVLNDVLLKMRFPEKKHICIWLLLTFLTCCPWILLKCLQKFIKFRMAATSNWENLQCLLCPPGMYACYKKHETNI